MTRLALHVAATLALGAFLVTTPAPLPLVAGFGWAYLLVRWARADSAAGRRAGVEIGIGVALMVSVVTGAALAPCKTVDRVLARTMRLERDSFTLGELREGKPHRREGQILCWFSVPERLSGQAVRFPGRTISLRQMIAAVEEQTPLRHRFFHCGNGLTILWGGDCSFLGFREPERGFRGD